MHRTIGAAVGGKFIERWLEDPDAEDQSVMDDSGLLRAAFSRASVRETIHEMGNFRSAVPAPAAERP